MRIAAGTRLGSYEIVALLGSGGMGEVYRARDTRLGRDVAIKVLPPEFSADRARVARFEREARSASALNHPNIITIHEIGVHDETTFIAMELVEGSTLRALLSSGPLPLKRVLSVAAQIAAGLAKAHEAGIVHRDLKPENVMVRPDGIVKILDFGLAKAALFSAAEGSNTPTSSGIITSHAGQVLGSVGYMSPEQASGHPLDYRSDQFVVGEILYEMLTGKRAFERASPAQTLAAIIEDEPVPIAELNARVPAPVRWVMERCLAKDPADRYASSSDLERDLANLRDRLSESSISQSGIAGVAPPVVRRRAWQSAALAVGGILLGAVATWWATQSHRTPAEPLALAKFTYSGHDSSPDASPDGARVAFASARDDSQGIWIKQMATNSETQLTKGADAFPRFSPDGSTILFVRREGEATSLYRISAVGGEPRRILTNVREADWSPDGKSICILRAAGEGKSGSALLVASAEGGEEKPLLHLEDFELLHPRWSLDGQTIAVLRQTLSFTVRWGRAILLVNARSGQATPLDAPTGQGYAALTWEGAQTLLYTQGRDIDSVFWGGATPTRLIRHHVPSGKVATVFWVPVSSYGLDRLASGGFVFETANGQQSLLELPLPARESANPGGRSLTRGESTDRQPRYSPDGRWLAFASNRSGNLDVWALERATGKVRQLTDHPADDWDPSFTPDGKLLWSSSRGGRYEVWLAESDGSNPRKITSDGDGAENPTMGADGQVVIYDAGSSTTGGIWKRNLRTGDAAFLAARRGQWPEASPDGKYALYMEPGAGMVSVRVARVADSVIVGEIRVVGGGSGRAKWHPGGQSIAFLDKDEAGSTAIFLQDFVPDRDTSSTRRVLLRPDSGALIESFAFAPDAKSVTVAVIRGSTNLMLATPSNRPGS